ncbi:MAG: hypothetical protein IJA30_05215 [Bacilli bacterium]|nr:hypothetical protein [Bacilli bacterium]
MSKFKKLLLKLKKIPKTRYIAILAVIVLAVAIAIPTLSRYKNRIDINALLSDENNWDGTVASSYRSGNGTSSDPYIISNAKELAYFEKMLNETNYENTYFELSNDIIINNGLFDYDEENITYTLNKTKLYVKEYTTDIYNSKDFTQDKLSSINSFNTLDNFKGHFNGNYYSIYGLYITSNTQSELALFNNLKGTVKNLYLENILIYGGSTTSSLATNITNSKVEDIFVDGDIVGTTNKKYVNEINSLEDVEVKDKLTTITLPETTKVPSSIKLFGTYTSSKEDKKITINDKELSIGDFELDLGTTPLTSINVVVEELDDTELKLSNLKYTITYEEDTYAISAGVVAKTSSSTLTNIINKAKVYGTNESAGIIGQSSNTDLLRAYNTASIKGENIASGLIGTIDSSLSETKISNVYNTGTLSAIATSAFVNKISNNEKITLENAFNTKEAFYSINKVENTEVNINNVSDVNLISVSTGTLKGEITSGIKTDTLTHTVLKETYSFSEYIDSQDLNNNKDNAWVYEEGYYPILYFDDLNNPIATLYVGTYSWNDLGYNLRDLYIKNEVGLRIVSNDELNPYKEAYYHIHKGTGLKTREEVGQITDWSLYEEMVKITEEGYYTIYVKVVDKNDTITYLNSERLVVDLKEPTATLTMNDKNWNDLASDLDNINILEKTNLTVTSTGGYADITSTKYHISTKILTEEELKTVEWKEYKENIQLTECGNYVVYVQVTDAADRVKYINSDNIVFGGYKEEISLGRDTKIDTDKVNITSKSSVTYNFKYDEERTYQENDTNTFITSVDLPKSTIMTLIDNTTKEVYKYKTTGEENKKYQLNKFVKVGQTDKTNIFSDESYTNKKNKDISITLDFSQTEISEKLTFEAHLELINFNKEAVVSTLKDTIKEITVYNDKDMNLVINKLNSIETIKYNSDSETEIKLENYIANKEENNNVIYDTTTENKKLGIAIKLLDEEDKIVEKKHLKNIQFKVGDNIYSPDNDGIVRIQVANNLDKTETTLKIITYLSTTKLELGDYNFIITPYVANDGKYTSDLSAKSINIPVKVTNKLESGYGFNAIITTLDEENKETEFRSVISKTKEEAEEIIQIPTTKIKIKILDTTTVKEKQIRVSLYKRATNVATDQTYELVDLKDYIKGNLNSVEDKVYSLDNYSTILEFDNNKFENNGYELRFELYDGTRKITSIKKKFIVI